MTTRVRSRHYSPRRTSSCSAADPSPTLHCLATRISQKKQGRSSPQQSCARTDDLGRQYLHFENCTMQGIKVRVMVLISLPRASPRRKALLTLLATSSLPRHGPWALLPYPRAEPFYSGRREEASTRFFPDSRRRSRRSSPWSNFVEPVDTRPSGKWSVGQSSKQVTVGGDEAES